MHQNSHLSCFRPCSRSRCCSWMASPGISFDVVVGFHDRASSRCFQPCLQQQIMSYPAPCQIIPLCATWFILNARLCLQGERVEWGQVTHLLVSSTEMCAGTAGLEENCVRLHPPTAGKGLPSLGQRTKRTGSLSFHASVPLLEHAC